MSLSAARKRGLANVYAKASAASSPALMSYGQFTDIDTTTGAVTVKLPASPDPGDYADLRWAAGATAPTVDGNGITLDGAGLTLALTAFPKATIRYRYDSDRQTWVSTVSVDTVSLAALIAANSLSPSQVIALAYGGDALA